MRCVCWRWLRGGLGGDDFDLVGLQGGGGALGVAETHSIAETRLNFAETNGALNNPRRVVPCRGARPRRRAGRPPLVRRGKREQNKECSNRRHNFNFAKLAGGSSCVNYCPARRCRCLGRALVKCHCSCASKCATTSRCPRQLHQLVIDTKAARRHRTKGCREKLHRGRRLGGPRRLPSRPAHLLASAAPAHEAERRTLVLDGHARDGARAR